MCLGLSTLHLFFFASHLRLFLIQLAFTVWSIKCKNDPKQLANWINLMWPTRGINQFRWVLNCDWTGGMKQRAFATLIVVIRFLRYTTLIGSDELRSTQPTSLYRFMVSNIFAVVVVLVVDDDVFGVFRCRFCCCWCCCFRCSNCCCCYSIFIILLTLFMAIFHTAFYYDTFNQMYFDCCEK